MEKISYLNLPNCYRLTNGTVEVVVATDVGPRILRYAFVNSENVLAEIPGLKVVTPWGDWKPWGGHRLWTAPEDMPRTYSPDGSPVGFKIIGDREISLTQAVEPQTGIEKQMTVTLDMQGSGVRIGHRLRNRNVWEVELAPWAITIMRGGGETIFPQEPFRSHEDYLLPARPMVLWHYTDLSDTRWTFGKKFIRLRTDATLEAPQKLGIANKQGWAAYSLKGTLFVKRVTYSENERYPDYGANVETYTSGSFMEIETLGPLERLQPGVAAEHVETWSLHQNVDVGSTEASLEAALKPLV